MWWASAMGAERIIKILEVLYMSRELKEIRTNVNEELVMAINEAVDYCNKYHSCLYFDDDEDDDRYTVDEHCEEAEIEDAKILLALQDKAIELMKRATYEEMELAFPLNTDAFDSTQVYPYELTTTQNVLEYIKLREHYNTDLEVFFADRLQARITVGEF